MIDSVTGEFGDQGLGFRSIVEGNRVTVVVRYWNYCDEPVTGFVDITDLKTQRVLSVKSEKITMHPIDQEAARDPSFVFPIVKVTFNTKYMYNGINADTGKLTALRFYDVRFTADDGRIRYGNDSQAFSVKPRPVVLIHGYRDTEESWKSYVEKFLPSMTNDAYTNIPKGYAIDALNTSEYGFLSSTSTIDQNAQTLKSYIDYVKRTEGAEQVDIIAHSMGGLAARRYISKYMFPGRPDVDRLIMLGTPNAGSNRVVSSGFRGGFRSNMRSALQSDIVLAQTFAAKT